MKAGQRAIVLIVETARGERFFVHFNGKGHVMTGWSLPSATLFQDLPHEIEDPKFKRVKDRLDRAGKRWRAATVILEPEPEGRASSAP